MPGLPPGGAAVDGGGGLSILYAGTMAESTLAGAHALGATTLTLASAAGFRADMTFGVGRVEPHDIVAVDMDANEIEIAAPGLGAAYVDGAAVFCAPMFGAAGALALPGGARLAEIDVRFSFDLPRAAGDPFYNGRSDGAYYADPHASWYRSLTNFSYWYAGGNTESDLPSYTVGLAHATAGFANFWVVDYEIATGRLIFLPADPGIAAAYVPRVRVLTCAGRA